MARLPPSRHSLHCGLRIPDLRARDDSPLNRSCHQGVPAICLMRRLPAQSIRRCGLNATFRTRLQQCDGDWWPLSPRCYRVAHAARLGTDTEICDTVRLNGFEQFGLTEWTRNELAASYVIPMFAGEVGDPYAPCTFEHWIETPHIGELHEHHARDALPSDFRANHE